MCSPKRPRSTAATRAIATNPLQKAPAKKYQPKSVLRHTGASDMTRSNEINVYTTANSDRDQRSESRIECGGNSMSSVATAHARASSPRDTRMNAKLTAAITPSPIPSRAKRNGTFSHAGLLRNRMRHPREDLAAAEVQSEEQKKSDPQKRRERLAEPIRRRAAPLAPASDRMTPTRPPPPCATPRKKSRLTRYACQAIAAAPRHQREVRTRSRRSRSSRPPTALHRRAGDRLDRLRFRRRRARDAPFAGWCSSPSSYDAFTNNFFGARLFHHRLDSRRFALVASNHDSKSILAEARRRIPAQSRSRQSATAQDAEEAENSAEQDHQLEADDDERRPRHDRLAARVEAPLVSCADRYREAGENAGNSARQHDPSHRTLLLADRMLDSMAGYRRERVESPTCAARNSSIACAHSASSANELIIAIALMRLWLDPSSSALRSQTIPSLSSVIEMIGRNLENNENSPRNHAKLPTVIMISVIDGWKGPTATVRSSPSANPR